MVANARASRFTIDAEAKFPTDVVCPHFADGHAKPILFVASKSEQVVALQRLARPERALQHRHRSAEPIMVARDRTATWCNSRVKESATSIRV
jgi:hypothetical protein